VFATDLASDLDLTLVDVEQLEQVIVNVITNARDAMPNGGKLRIATSNCIVDQSHARRHLGAMTGAHIRLSISDNGCGMNEATLSRVFEPFFTTKGAAGTGLGLSTAYGIIQQSSGHIVVKSAIDAGTVFDIYLPAVHDAPNALPQLSTAVPTRGRETIVLVEDDSSVRSLTLRMLVNGGYTVIEAANGADALDTIRAWGGMVDLVITDAMMPVMNGGELAESLATEYPAIKVLFMSLYTGDDIVKRGTDSRRAFIPKPFTTTNLMQKVREVLTPRGNAE
jgi:two-component system, cell cycle sensor histidine kinase and response regulator CckA